MGFDDDVGAVLVDESDEGFFIALLDHGIHKALEGGDDAGIRGLVGDLVFEGGFEVFDAISDLAEFEIADGEIDVEGTGVEGIPGAIALFEELLVHPDGGVPLLRALGGFTPTEQGALVEDVATALCLGGIVGVFAIAVFEGLHGILPALELHLADAPAVPGDTELGAEEHHRVLVEAVRAGGKELEGFLPLAGVHRIRGGGVERLRGGIELGMERSGGEADRDGRTDEGGEGVFEELHGGMEGFLDTGNADSPAPQGGNGSAPQFLGSWQGKGGRLRGRRDR
ncbi:MAG: hypothetical protein MUF31_10300 [Akkermansiaceae bacterium]|nr:hypothetical protein [Akkermansiaceae bacterium]